MVDAAQIGNTWIADWPILPKFGRMVQYAYEQLGSWLNLTTTGGTAALSGNASLIANFPSKPINRNSNRKRQNNVLTQ